MAAVVAAIAASTGAGVLAMQRLGPAAQRLSNLALGALFWVFVPFVTFFSLARLHVTAGVGAGLGLGAIELVVVGASAYLIGARILHLPRATTGALIVVTTVVNTSYLGLPLIAAVLGRDALAPAIAWDSLVSGPFFYIGGLTIGAMFGTQAGASLGARLRTLLLRNPPLIAAVAGLLAPRSLAPDAAIHAVHAVVYVLLPLGFFALGVNLAGEHGVALSVSAPLAAAIGLRLVLAPALLALLSALTVAVPHAYLFQAAMPSAINSLVIAHAYGLDLRLTASALAWTTALVMVAAVVVVAL
jgi:hypothetical protein